MLKNKHVKRLSKRVREPHAESVVEQPSHYNVRIKDINGKEHECQIVDIIEALYVDSAHLSQAMKYLGRCGRKASTSLVEDLAKARWWITRYINCLGGHPEVK